MKVNVISSPQLLPAICKVSAVVHILRGVVDSGTGSTQCMEFMLVYSINFAK